MTSWTSPRTWVASEVVGASTMNTHVRDNLNHLSEQISRTSWTSFTPAWTNLTPGSGTNVGYYAYAGKTTFFRVEFTLGAGSSVGTDPIFQLPQTAVTYDAWHRIGWAILEDTGTAIYDAALIIPSTTAAQIKMPTVAGSYLALAQVTATVPFTWGTGDKILVSGFYERA